MNTVPQKTSPVNSPKARTVARTNTAKIDDLFTRAVSAMYHGRSGITRETTVYDTRAAYSRAQAQGSKPQIIIQPDGHTVTVELGFGWIDMRIPDEVVTA